MVKVPLLLLIRFNPLNFPGVKPSPSNCVTLSLIPFPFFVFQTNRRPCEQISIRVISCIGASIYVFLPRFLYHTVNIKTSWPVSRIASPGPVRFCSVLLSINLPDFKSVIKTVFIDGLLVLLSLGKYDDFQDCWRRRAGRARFLATAGMAGKDYR